MKKKGIALLFAIFSFLSCRTATMGSGDVFLLFGFSLNLAIISRTVRCAAASPRQAPTGNNCVYIVAFAHNCFFRINDGTSARQ